MKASITIFGVLLLSTFHVFAALPPSQAVFKNTIAQKGALQGGSGGIAFSLLDFKLQKIESKGLEAVTIFMGDRVFSRLEGPPAFHHIEKKGTLVVLNIKQTIGSRLNEQQIQKQFLKSKLIESVSTYFNAESANLTIQFRLKSADSKVRLGALSGSPKNRRDAAIRIDFLPAQSSLRK